MNVEELKERIRVWYSFYPINDDREALDEIMEILDSHSLHKATKLEIKPHKWEEKGESYSSDFFPFIGDEPRHDLADCQHCEFYIPESNCQKVSKIPDNKLYPFCGNICGYFVLNRVEAEEGEG